MTKETGDGGSSGGSGYVRADKIDLKSIDEQLERFSRAVTLEKSRSIPASGTASVGVYSEGLPLIPPRRERKEWEIDPSKLTVKGVIARGTFGTVHRGIYDGQDVAGQSPFFRSSS